MRVVSPATIGASGMGAYLAACHTLLWPLRLQRLTRLPLPQTSTLPLPPAIPSMSPSALPPTAGVALITSVGLLSSLCVIPETKYSTIYARSPWRAALLNGELRRQPQTPYTYVYVLTS